MGCACDLHRGSGYTVEAVERAGDAERWVGGGGRGAQLTVTGGGAAQYGGGRGGVRKRCSSARTA